MKWSNTQIKQIIDEYNQDISCTKIAKEFNVSTATISKLLKDNGVNVINKQNLITFSPKDIISDYNSGISVIKLIKKYHTSYDTIKKIFDKNNITIVNKQNRTKFNESIFDNIDSEEKAYWLGFIYADGYISSRDNTFELSLALKDKEHLDKFNVFMQHENNNVKTDSFRCRWSVVNKHLWETLNNYGCTPRKSLTLKFPDISIFSSKSLVRHFIRGYIDGDGSIMINKPILEILGTVSFLNSLQQYLPYSGSIIHDKRSKVHCVRYGCTPAVANIEAVYYKANIFLTRKYNKYLQIRNCRFKAKALKLLEGKIGEGWDANPELTAYIKEMQQCNA